MKAEHIEAIIKSMKMEDLVKFNNEHLRELGSEDGLIIDSENDEQRKAFLKRLASNVYNLEELQCYLENADQLNGRWWVFSYENGYMETYDEPDDLLDDFDMRSITESLSKMSYDELFGWMDEVDE